MTPETIDTLVQAALAADLAEPERRSLLLFGYPAGLQASLPTRTRPADQVRSDLQVLSGLIHAGEPGHFRWLRNALHLADFRPEAAVFQAALAGRPPLPAPEARALQAAADVIRQRKVSDGATGVELAAGERAAVVVEQDEVTGVGTVGVKVGALPSANPPSPAAPVFHQTVHHVADGGVGIQNNITQLPPPPPMLADLLDKGTLRLPRNATPAQHLIARHQVVDFLGREDLLADLDTWAAGRGVSVRLIHGDGGAGKTRLATQWLNNRPGGFITGELTPERIDVLAAAHEADVVLDYAESRPGLPDLLKALARRWNTEDPGRLRLLLLARGAGDWWENLKANEAIAALLNDAPVALQLPPVPEADRARHFTHAAACFARHRPWPGLPIPPDLKDPRFGRPLYLHMAAFLAGEGEKVTADTVLGTFLDHEGQFWQKRAGFEGKETTDPARALRHAVERTVAALTLRNGARDADHLDATLAGLELRKKERKQIKELLIDIYATPTQLAGPLEPDILGEALVLRLLRAAKHHPRWLDQAVVGADEAELTHTFTVLGRAEALDPKEEAILPAERHLLRDPTRALPAFHALAALSEVTAHARLGQVLAEALGVHGTPELAAALEPHLVERFQHTVQLREVAAWVEATLSARQTNAEARARQLNNLGVRLGDLGRWEEAFAATTKAVQCYRALAAAQPDTFLPDLAMSLANLGGDLSALSRQEEALAATAKAVELYRTLVAVRPAFAPELAASLNNLGAMLSALGRREEALVATNDAVELNRILAATPSGALLPHLAGSLNNLGNILSTLGRWEQALAATAEAVERSRAQVAARPDAFLPDLAGGLNNLGAVLSALGRREEALDATAEAVGSYRILAKARPNAFQPDLAMSLNNLGNLLSALGRREEALAALAEAVERYRALAKARPDVFLSELAMSLNNQGLGFAKLGQWEDALAAFTESVALRRTLAAERPDAFLPELARSVGSYGKALAALDRAEDARQAADEALDLLWPFFERLPAAHSDLMKELLKDCFTRLKGPPPPALLERLQRFQALT